MLLYRRLARLSLPSQHAALVRRQPGQEADIRRTLKSKRFHTAPLGSVATTPDVRAARIAWLIENGWSDPIELDFGVPGYPGYNSARWIVDDGNHRLYAAIIAGRDTILANASGLQSEIGAYLA